MRRRVTVAVSMLAVAVAAVWLFGQPLDGDFPVGNAASCEVVR